MDGNEDIADVVLGSANFFDHFDDKLKKDIVSKLDKASYFSGGIGKIYPYLDNSLKRDIVSRLCTQSDFSLGVGEGLGKIYHYLKRELQRLHDC